MDTYSEITRIIPNDNLKYDEICEMAMPEPVKLGDIKVKSTVNASTLSFEMRRIKRLRQPYSKILLEKHMRYLTRNAELHDFAKK